MRIEEYRSSSKEVQQEILASKLEDIVGDEILMWEMGDAFMGVIVRNMPDSTSNKITPSQLDELEFQFRLTRESIMRQALTPKQKEDLEERKAHINPFEDYNL